jgi:hypothetical protein
MYIVLYIVTDLRLIPQVRVLLAAVPDKNAEPPVFMHLLIYAPVSAWHSKLNIKAMVNNNTGVQYAWRRNLRNSGIPFMGE